MIPKKLLTVFFLLSVLIDLVAEKFIHVHQLDSVKFLFFLNFSWSGIWRFMLWQKAFSRYAFSSLFGFPWRIVWKKDESA